jgi:hypothetical protein
MKTKCKECEKQNNKYDLYEYTNTVTTSVEAGGNVLSIKQYGCSNGHKWEE